MFFGCLFIILRYGAYEADKSVLEYIVLSGVAMRSGWKHAEWEAVFSWSRVCAESPPDSNWAKR